jgi:hypothetical protein
MYGVKSVGSSRSSSSESTEVTAAMRHRLLDSSSRRSSAKARSGAGIKPTSTSSLMIGRPPSSSPARCRISSFSRRLVAETRGEEDISMTLSRRTRGTISARSDVKIGLCLLLRNGYEFKFVNRSYEYQYPFTQVK